MAVKTWLDIKTRDAQGRSGDLSFRIKPAAFGATTIPGSVVIGAVINAIFGDAKLSSSIVVSYAVRVEEDTPAAVGGSGDVASSQALRTRSEVATDNWLASIPGLLESNVVFDPTNPNSVSTVGTLWTNVRAALADADIAVSPPDGAYSAAPEDDIFQVATVYDGKRTPMRPR